MRGFNYLFFFSCTLLLLVLLFPAEANINAESDDIVYIVYMGGTRSANGDPRTHYHAQLLSMLMQRKKNSVVHTYNNGFLGFAARLSDEEAKLMEEIPGVVSVFPDRVLKLHTTRSWDFLSSLSDNSRFDSIPTSSAVESWPSNGNADTIIGILDTGIWPESPSFQDKYMSSIPSSWNGTCMSDKNSSPINCNRKVIGARYYDDVNNPGAIVTAMDMDGHGTHAASIAAGVPVPGASYYGLAQGIARGGSPGSRLAGYNVCMSPASRGCLASAILNAFDDAIKDGVHVISLSIGFEPGPSDFSTDPIAIGAFHAVQKGITVVSSAGNDGPGPETVVNVAPWIITVGATNIDREFQVLLVCGKNKLVVQGRGINVIAGRHKYGTHKLVDARAASIQSDVTNASNCVPGSLDPKKVKDSLVLCENDDAGIFGPLQDKIASLNELGAVGMILMDDILAQVPDGIRLIGVVNKRDGDQVRSYIRSTRNAVATISRTRVMMNTSAPVTPFFSSRGPTAGIKNLLKPDVAAPGVGILAAWIRNDTSVALTGATPPLFNIVSGTSVASPHVSGLAALIKSHHPGWSASAIKSAIMTSAIQRNNRNGPIETVNGSKATPYEIGAGEISTSALQPGLVYETEIDDYIQFLCNFGYNASVIQTIASGLPGHFSCPRHSSPDFISDMNYPSIAVTGLKANMTRKVNRTVTNVGASPSTYTVQVEAPPGVQVQVVPNKLQFSKNVKKISFQVKLKLTARLQKDSFGSLTWSSGSSGHLVRSAIAVSSA